MIRLFKLKDQQREDAGNTSGRTGGEKQSAGELRLHKDISELSLPKTSTISFPNGKDDLMNFDISIRPDEGYYLGGKFNLNSKYPLHVHMNLQRSSAKLSNWTMGIH